MRNFITLKDYRAEDLEKIINTALQIKKHAREYNHALAGRKLYMLFQKTSTRTSLSFQAGINEMGGSFYTQQWQESNFAVGEIKDEVRYVGRNVDLIMARLKQHEDIIEMAQYSTVPVINGCCNRYHPCQAMADMLTVRELFGFFGIKLMYVGVRNNVFNSLVSAVLKLGGELFALTPIANEASDDPELMAWASGTGRFHEVPHEHTNMYHIRETVNDMDVIYTDTWIDMEFFYDKSYAYEKRRRIQLLMPLQLNKDLMKNTRAKVFHDMPMHPGFEIDREIIEEHIDTILQQAENRRHAQKAIMLALLEDNKIGETEDNLILSHQVY